MTKSYRSMLALVGAVAVAGWIGTASAAPEEKAAAPAAKADCCQKGKDGKAHCNKAAATSEKGAAADPAAHAGCAKGDHAGCSHAAKGDRAGMHHARGEGCPHMKQQAAAAGDADAKKAAFACPMHPEVTSATKDRCPKCKMFLEPVS